MASPCAFRWRKQIRQEDHIVLRVSSICPLAIDRRREGAVTTLAEILSNNFVFMRNKKSAEGFADQLERKKVGGSAMSEDLDLDFDREAPRGEEDPGMPRWDRSLGPPFLPQLIAARTFCTDSWNLEVLVILSRIAWIGQLQLGPVEAQ
ncbi:hypothetical protein N7512_009671 [Penicillium capsulatum]|nr:hypothetical protein N7512_009671 [Penicillium capsulatum]